MPPSHTQGDTVSRPCIVTKGALHPQSIVLRLDVPPTQLRPVLSLHLDERLAPSITLFENSGPSHDSAVWLQAHEKSI